MKESLEAKRSSREKYGRKLQPMAPFYLPLGLCVLISHSWWCFYSCSGFLCFSGGANRSGVQVSFIQLLLGNANTSSYMPSLLSETLFLYVPRPCYWRWTGSQCKSTWITVILRATKTRVGLCFFIFVDLDHLLPSTLFNGETDL